jgi:cell division septum initiation protein DivIVA
MLQKENAGVAFSEQRLGYDKQQVEVYIKRVSSEYQDMYSEYISLLDKCKEFAETCIKLTNEKTQTDTALVHAHTENAALRDEVRALQSGQQPATAAPEYGGNQTAAQIEAIARALIDAEFQARHITSAANLEADRTLDEARREAARLIDDARREAILTAEQTRQDVYRSIEESKLEAARTVAQARQETALLQSERDRTIEEIQEIRNKLVALVSV